MLGSDNLLMFLLFSIFLATTFMLIKKHRRPTKNLPPGPRKLPIIGNLHQLGSLPHISLQKLSEIHGPLMFLQLGSVPALVVSSADTAREVFKTHDLAFSGRPRPYAASKFTYGCSDMVFASYGEFWREVRKIVVSELLSAKRVQSFRQARAIEVSALLDSIRSCLVYKASRTIETASSSPINLSELTLLVSTSFVCRVAFTGGGRSRRFHAVLGETQALLGGFCVADFFPGLEWINKFNGLEKMVDKNFLELDRFYDEVIEEHLDPERPEPEQEDLVDVLLRVQRDPNQAITLTDKQLKGVITDIFNAGTDTSAAALVWTMSELIKNPTVMKRAKEEVRRAVKEQEHVQEDDLEKLVYLKAVVKEGLRLHPPVPLSVPRETSEACTIGGYTIPAKTRVFLNIRPIATDPKWWEDPEEFRPERFLNNSVDFMGNNFEFLPFGAGRRGCPGINFAVQLIELELASLLHDFDWELPQGMRREELDMEGQFGLTLHKKVPLWLVAKPVALRPNFV